MTDREMLELAAKAAGVVVDADGRFEFPHGLWNPLNDDGDALRLAVKLEIYDLDRALVALDISERTTAYHLDPYAATRRAIVRAAAEIGKAMP